jgi:outer membrane immunogenic protein
MKHLLGRTALAVGLATTCAALMSASALAGDGMWSGVYVGAVGGYASDTMDIVGAPPPAGPPTQDLEGGLLGATIGINWDTGGPLVIGLEADLSAAHMSDTKRDGNYLVESGTISSLGTLRARLGWKMGDFLPFITGGYMWDEVEQTFSCPDDAAVPFGFCRPVGAGGSGKPGGFNLASTETQSGWIYGLGVEYRINGNWSVKIEDLFGEFDEQDYNLGKDGKGNDKLLTTEQSLDNLFRFGVNYHF